ncbi:tail fiber assembly protein [Pseudomonas protegens]|uniref:tail fiber assembly protein n=1 Tax=Pseudomonas protegens TaxID=380021 RepID=UPI00275A9C68|nr:tail fiber assembly protein [Pseudomonas protegens]MDP9528467.1 tail fiber assembly protein [Pseudomonas protegens]
MMRRYARISSGKVFEFFETEGDITGMFHPDLVWCDVTDITPQPNEGWDAVLFNENWVFEEPKPIEIPKEILLEQAKAEVVRLMSHAELMMAPLKYASELGMSTDKDAARLLEWKKYAVAVMRVNEQREYPFTIKWPDQPT